MSAARTTLHRLQPFRATSPAERARRGPALSRSILPRVLRGWVRPALAALLCTGGASVAAPASADVLVSNFAQSVGDPSTLNADSTRNATSFTTGGGTGKYTLESVELVLGGIGSGDRLTVTIRDDSSGSPGSVHATLTNPSLRDGPNTFTAPSGAELAASKTYWVHVERNAGTFSLRMTESNREDRGRAGWSIADSGRHWNGSAWTAISNAASHGIRVNGAEKTPPASADNTVSTNEDTTYTFKLSDFAFTDADTNDELAQVVFDSPPAAGTLQAFGRKVSSTTRLRVDATAFDSERVTYVPAPDGHGTPYTMFTFKVVASDQAESARHTMTLNVTPVNDAPEWLPAVSGAARVGGTLTADTSGIRDVDGLGTPDWSYQWVRQDDAGGGGAADIPGATGSTYTLVMADLGKHIAVEVGFTDDDGTAEGPLRSPPVGRVLASPGSSQVAAEGFVWLKGSDMRFADMTLKAAHSGVFDANGLSNPRWAWQWVRMDDESGANAQDIAGAADKTYTTTRADLGKWLAARLRFTDDGSNPETLTSAAVEGPTRDVAGPVKEKAWVDGDQLTVVWNEALASGRGCRTNSFGNGCVSNTLARAFAVTVGGSARALTRLEVFGGREQV